MPALLIVFSLFIMIWALIYPVVDYWNRFLSVTTLRKGSCAKREIALTFDDGPNPMITPEVLKILADYKIPACFFLVGHRSEKYPELTKQILKSGHEIGVHTYYHQHAYLMFWRRSLETLRKGRQILEEIAKEKIIWFRPPWGALNLFQFLLYKRMGLKMVLWSANAADWDVRSAPAVIFERLKQKVIPGAIIVIHDDGGEPGAPENMLKALPEIIDYFQKNNYQFVSLSRMAGGE